jgi:hypothetical protein
MYVTIAHGSVTAFHIKKSESSQATTLGAVDVACEVTMFGMQELIDLLDG